MIGQGGFAVVYRGRDTALDRQVALKELRPILLQDTTWADRFRREARTIARLDHPNIVPIYDVYDVQQRLFIVMRLVDGVSLEEHISEQGGLPWPEVLEIFGAVSEGLNHAHNHGILHRDLKPANILIDRQRGPMLSDFGLAKLAGETSMGTTAAGGVVGTPQYIAPEVWEGQGTTAQSDIYALGCILYEMLTGERVFQGDTPPAIMMAHFRPPNLPRSWPDNVPTGVTEVITTALAQDPTDRYGSVLEMSSALARLSSAPTSDTEAAAAGSITPAESPAGDSKPTVESPPVADPKGLKLGAAETPSLVADTELASQPEPAQPTATTPQQAVATPQLSSPRPQSEVDQVPSGRRTRRARRRGGCVWLGLAGVIGLVILVVAGAGTFCSTAGTMLSTAFSTVELGETVSEAIRVPLPDGSDIPDLVLEFGVGRLDLKPGADGALVDGTITYNVEQLKPEVVQNGNEIRIQAEEGIGLAGFTTGDVTNFWDLRLAAVPVKLAITGGGAGNKIELGGLSVQDLSVMFGGADLDLSFSEPNQIEMNLLELAGGASNANMTGLANARAGDITFQGAAGSFTFDFSGELQDDLDVRIEAGLGTVVLIVPAETAAEVVVSGTLANVSTDGAWQKTDKGFFLPGEAGSGNKIEIDVEMGPGSLELRTQ
jgi:serine/threonine-protein kinase